LLLIVGSIGLFINLIGLVIFGHAHSHNIPAVIAAEDDDDDDDDDDVSVVSSVYGENHKKKMNSPEEIECTDLINKTVLYNEQDITNDIKDTNDQNQNNSKKIDQSEGKLNTENTRNDVVRKKDSKSTNPTTLKSKCHILCIFVVLKLTILSS
jgi:hypothetical protein